VTGIGGLMGFFFFFIFYFLFFFYVFFGNNRFAKRLERKRTGSPVAQPFGGREGHRKRNRIIVEIKTENREK
jgi:hypothetical protein